MSTAETIEVAVEGAQEAPETTTQPEENTANEPSSFASEDQTDGEAVSEEGEETKGDEEAETKADEDQPAEYAEFTVPDGIELEPERLDSAKELFGSLGLSQENAQKLVDWYVQDQATVAEQSQAAEQRLQQERLQETLKDPEFGGPNEKATRENYLKAARVFGREFPGGRSFMRTLQQYGIADEITVVDFLSTIGASIQEDAGGSGGDEPGGGNPLEKMYPSMFED